MKKIMMALGFWWTQSAFAQTSLVSYGEQAVGQQWLQQEKLSPEVHARYQARLKALYRDDSVLAKISRPAEKAKPWFEYRKIFADQARLDAGIAFYQQHQSALLRAEQEFGVDARIIVAILGVETRYGKVMGNTEVLRSLATLCFDYPPRAKFFCTQLRDSMNLLEQLAQSLGLDPLQVRGSYAGAMGMAQFMPSSYLNDAVDYDGDGKIDLFNSPVDAIGSIANYLKNRGWEAGGAYVYALPFKPQRAEFGVPMGKSHQPKHKALWWLAAEQNRPELQSWLAEYGDEKVGTLILQGDLGEEYWLTLNNFYVITRYNTSPMYAMAVVNLAHKIGVAVGRAP